MEISDVENIKRRMLIKYPFFGSAVASLKLKEAKGLGTVGTDGKSIYYDPEFLGKLNDDEQSFIFAHEICHIAFNHILRSEGKDQRVWNIATDAVINQFLKKDGLPLVEGGVDIAEAINYDAETLYEKMLKEEQERKEQQQQDNQGGESNDNKQNSPENGQNQFDGSGNSSSQNNEQHNQQNNEQQNGQSQENGQNQNSQDNQQNNNQQNSGGQNSSGNNEQQNIEQQGSSGNGDSNDQPDETDSKTNDVGHDTHNMWEEAVRRYKQGNSENEQEQEQGQQNKNNKTQDEMADDRLKETQNKMSEMGEKKAFKKNEQTRKEQLEELLDALSRESKGAGITTNSEVVTMQDIGTSKPLIDWRLWLREAISMDVDWSYQNAEIEDGVIRPNLEAYPIPETEILLDTSGSVHDNLLKNFLRECKNILQASRVKVGCFDTKFYGWNEIRTLDDIDNLQYVGRGGTDFNVLANAFTKRVENKIIFTDGDASMPNTPINAIWIVYGGKKINPPGGKVIHITDEQLRKLCFTNETKQPDIGRRMR